MPLGSLKILNVVSQKHENVVVGRSALCLGNIDQLAKHVLGQANRQLGLIFHGVSPFLPIDSKNQ